MRVHPRTFPLLSSGDAIPTTCIVHMGDSTALKNVSCMYMYVLVRALCTYYNSKMFEQPKEKCKEGSRISKNFIDKGIYRVLCVSKVNLWCALKNNLFLCLPYQSLIQHEYQRRCYSEKETYCNHDSGAP